MAVTQQEVHDYIMNYIDGTSTAYGNWYVGIAEEAKDCLFSRHKVNKEHGSWVFSRAETSNDARDVEDFIIKSYKTKGGGGGGSDKTKYVYAYYITQTTVE